MRNPCASTSFNQGLSTVIQLLVSRTRIYIPVNGKFTIEDAAARLGVVNKLLYHGYDTA